MNDFTLDFDELPASAKIAVNQVCNRLEESWRLGHGEPIDPLLDLVADEHRLILLRELLTIEFACRHQAGLESPLAEYQSRFPELPVEWLAETVSAVERHVVDRNAPRNFDRFNNFQILEEIGRGGMGIVYRAREEELDREVALKTLPQNAFLDPIQLQRFQLEARAVATLDHPNIVPVYEVGSADGHPYLVMKLIDGMSVSDQLQCRTADHTSRADQHASVNLVAKIADAIQHAHQHGILHRDLKPANILLDASQTPYVTDFGLAKILQPDAHPASTVVQGLTNTNVILGTPAYMAPEQASGASRLTTAVDVYALGAILYELLTGSPPFVGKNSMDVMQRVINDTPTPPSRLVRGLPRDLETICLKCLEKHPPMRYQSAGDLSADLRNFLQGKPISAFPAPVWTRCVRLAKRHPVVSMLIAAIALILFLSVAVVTQKWQETTLANANMEHALLQEKTTTYISLIEYARRELNEGNLQTARRLLDQIDPPLRSVEYDYLRHRLQRSGRILEGHQGAVSAVVCHGDWIASGGDDATIRIWDATTGKTLHILSGHDHAITSLAFSDDGKWLASGDRKGHISIWNVTEMQVHRNNDTIAGPVTALAFHPTSNALAAGTANGMAAIISMQGEVRAFEGVHGHIQGLAFNRRGTTLAIATRRRAFVRKAPDKSTRGTAEIQLWDVAAHKRTTTLPGHAVRNTADMRAICFSRTRSYPRLVSAGGSTIHIWQEQAWEHPSITLRGHEAIVDTVAIERHGRFVASGSTSGMVKLWDAYQGTVLSTFRGHQGAIRSVQFWNECIVSAGQDGTVRIWSRVPEHASPNNRRAGEVTAVGVGPTGLCVRALHGTNRDATSRPVIKNKPMTATLALFNAVATVDTELVGPCKRISVSPHAEQVVCVGAEGVRLVNLKGNGSKELTDAHGTMAVVWSDDSALVVTSHSDGKVRTWDASRGTPVATYDVDEPSDDFPIAYCTATKSIAGISDSRSVFLIDGRGKLQELPGATGTWTAVAISHQGDTLAAAAEDGRIWTWDVASHAVTRQITTRSRQPIRCLSFSGDGRRLASLSDAGTITFWDTLTNRAVFSADGPRTVLRRFQRSQTKHCWDLGFGSQPGSFYAVTQGRVAWFPGY